MNKIARFAGKVALVTGAGSGIGRATALRLASEGARVAVADIKLASAEATASEIAAKGGEAISIEADTSDAASVKAMTKRTVDAFRALHIGVNNAGIPGPMGVMIEMSMADVDRCWAINLKGVWLCMKSQIEFMLPAGGGSIVNVSSGAGLVGFKGSAPYVASKHGVVGLTRAAALDYASQNIRVNAVCPGVVDTAMFDPFKEDAALADAMRMVQPVERIATPDEIAGAIAWLASDGASFATGSIVPVDGGYSAR